MQLACPRCQARYAFDAAQIPQDGYDARCHRCEATFFVAPPAASPATVHRGPPTPAPASGPDDEAKGRSRAMAETLAAEAERFARGQQVTTPSRRPSLSSLFDGDLHDEASESSAGERGPDDDDDGRGAAGPNRPRPSRPWAHVTGRGEAEEEVPPRTRARLGLVVGMVCVALVTLGVVAGVVRSKQLHLPTQVPPPLHIVRDPPPEAVATFERGMAALRRDNAVDLDQAAQAFADARALDGDYTDAWAARRDRPRGGCNRPGRARPHLGPARRAR